MYSQLNSPQHTPNKGDQHTSTPKLNSDRVKAEKATVFDSTGLPHLIEPEFHVSILLCIMTSAGLNHSQHKAYSLRISELLQGMTAGYVEGVAPHVGDPDKSVIHIMSHEDFTATSPDVIHNILRHKNVVVRGTPHPLHKFDRQGLSYLFPLQGRVSLQG